MMRLDADEKILARSAPNVQHCNDSTMVQSLADNFFSQQ
jgi:hypothetical protein